METANSNDATETISSEKIKQYEQRLGGAASLDDLLVLLDDYREHVSCLEKTHVDHTCLPTFGGAEPCDTAGVWSWDETRLLRCDGGGEFYIETREEFETRDSEE